MDPSIALCSDQEVTFPSCYTNKSFSKAKNLKVYSEEDYTLLQKIKSNYENPDFLKARNLTNPFEKIGNSIFKNRAAVKLANIDAVLHLTEDSFSFVKRTSENNLTFCDVAAGPGGFTQYLQYRYPKSRGYGMTLKNSDDWDLGILDLGRFEIYYGPDNTGNLYYNWFHFCSHVLSKDKDGVDLVLGDGGIQTDYEQQEIESSRLLLVQCLVVLFLSKKHAVVKIFDTITEFSVKLLYLISSCFKETYIFKPCTSRPANSERYLILKHSNNNPRKESIKEYLKNVNEQMENRNDVTLEAEVSQDFVDFLYQRNQESIENQITAGERILRYLSKENPEVPVYNIHKFLKIWALPENQ